MKISLKKAGILQLALAEIATNTPLSTVVAISIFGNPADILAKQKEKFDERKARLLSINRAYYTLRSLVASANMEHNLSDLLASMNSITKELNLYSTIANSSPTLELGVIVSKIARIEKADQYSYGEDTVSVSIVTEADIKEAKEKVNELKKMRESIKEKLLVLNLNNTITVPDSVVEVLSSEGLI